MEATAEANIAHHRRGVAPMEHDEMDMNMRMRARKGGQAGQAGKSYPRVIIHIPEWMSQFTAISRGLKLVLAGVAFVACIGTYLLISDVMPDAPKLKSGGLGLSAMTKVDNDIPQNERGSPPPPGTVMASVLSNLADLDLPKVDSDIPFFVQLPYSGGAIISLMLGKCTGLVQALDASKYIDVLDPQKMEIVTNEEIGQIFTVNTFTPSGIAYAKANNLVYTGQVDAIFSPLLYDAARLFRSDHRGRIFTIISNPIERVNTHFYYVTSDPTNPNYDQSLNQMSIEDYAAQTEDRPEFNYLTKLFSDNLNKSSDELTIHDLNKAKEVFKRKVLIGLETHKVESIRRFELFFHLSFENEASDNVYLCGSGLPQWTKSSSAEIGPPLAPMDPVWNALFHRNTLDMELYEYVKKLYVDQGSLLSQ